MAVFNGARTLAETIESILAQSLTDLEIVAIEDGSTDGSAEVLKQFTDPRLRAICSPNYSKLTDALNRGLALARGQYIARVDADDICLPNRAAAQAAYLDANPDVAVVGSFMEKFTGDDTPIDLPLTRYPIDPGAVSAALIFRNTIPQPAAMLRAAALREHGICYNSTLNNRCEDYDLWARLAMHGFRMANLPEVLVRYRLHDRPQPERDRESEAAAAEVRWNLVAHLGIKPDPAQRAVHEAISTDQFLPQPTFIVSAIVWLLALADANDHTRAFDRDAFLRVLTGRYVSLSRFAAASGIECLPIEGTPFAAYDNSASKSAAA
jgi:Glycosyl transferase family 2